MPEYTLKEVPIPRGAACGEILRSLPDWFGLPQYIEMYEREIDELPTMGVYTQEDRLVGFITLHVTSVYTQEIRVMAISPDCHRQGIGTQLIEYAVHSSRAAGFELLQVKTLGPSRPDLYYDQTRNFYMKNGFSPDIS